MTTPEPGERLVLMYGATDRPASTAFLAKRPIDNNKWKIRFERDFVFNAKSVVYLPAPSMTLGLLVFVHEVMAAMTTDPCLNVYF